MDFTRMLGRTLLLILCLVSLTYSDPCQPDAPGAFKVRLSIKKALGDKAYRWDADEEFLFKAVMAFVMRAHVNNAIQISDILLCNVTQRVSFWFVVTSPSNSSEPIDSSRVRNAVRLERNRINSAFLLDDNTLEFLDIPPITAPPDQRSNRSWLIVFGVVVGILAVVSTYFIVSGIKRKGKKKSAEAEDPEEGEDKMQSAETVENGIHHENIRRPGGVSNETFDDYF